VRVLRSSVDALGERPVVSLGVLGRVDTLPVEPIGGFRQDDCACSLGDPVMFVAAPVLGF
jgi:hypothetical protein